MDFAGEIAYLIYEYYGPNDILPLVCKNSYEQYKIWRKMHCKHDDNMINRFINAFLYKPTLNNDAELYDLTRYEFYLKRLTKLYLYCIEIDREFAYEYRWRQVQPIAVHYAFWESNQFIELCNNIRRAQLYGFPQLYALMKFYVWKDKYWYKGTDCNTLHTFLDKIINKNNVESAPPEYFSDSFTLEKIFRLHR
jgi:hypothetical protein